jgi:signal transduction histidine kinase
MTIHIGPINNISTLLEAALYLVLLAVVPAWISYQYGRYKADALEARLKAEAELQKARLKAEVESMEAFGYQRGSHEAPLWRTVLEQIPLGVIIFDTTRRMLFENRLARDLMEQLEPGAVDRVYQLGTQVVHPATAIVRGGNSNAVDVEAWPLEKGSKGALLMIRDLVEQPNQGWQTIAYFRSQIRKLSHDIFNPLHKIQMELEAALEPDSHDEAERRGILEKALDETKWLEHLLDNLLELSRLESEQPRERQSAQMKDIAERAIEALQERADARNISLLLEADPSVPLVRVDKDSWERVFRNLIDNSIKYGKDNGIVRISVQRKMSMLRIAITDDGSGILPEDHPRLFKQVFRGVRSRKVRGSGLGLTIVHGIVAQHGGEIDCISEPGRETTFYINLPITDE